MKSDLLFNSIGLFVRSSYWSVFYSLIEKIFCPRIYAMNTNMFPKDHPDMLNLIFKINKVLDIKNVNIRIRNTITTIDMIRILIEK